MADKTTTLKTKTNDNVYPNVIGDNRDNAIVNSAHIKHTLTADHKINFRLDNNVSNLIFNSLQKPAGLTKTKLVGVGTNGQENIEIGDNLTLANGKLSSTGGGSGKSVPPTLNLIDWGNGEIRTSITEEEKTNLDNGLYNQVMYAPSISSFSGMISTYIPSKIMTVGDSKAFSYFVANESGNIIGLIFSPFTIGEKDPTTGNYPIIINEDDEEFLGIDVDIPTIEGEVKWVTSGSSQHRTIVMKSKPDVSADKFILSYVDGDSTNTILFNRVLHMTSPINFSGFVGNDYDNYYSCDSTSTDVNEMDIPKIDQTTLFNRWYIAVKHLDGITPQPILPLPADASTSTYVLKAVNGTVQWVKES